MIVAAIRVFAKRGFAEASVNEIADAADMVVSGIYYHFESKAQLFDAATAEVYESLDNAVEAARVGFDNSGSPEALASVIIAGNRWADDHPHASKMLYSQLPGATTESARLRDAHEARGLRHFGAPAVGCGQCIANERQHVGIVDGFRLVRPKEGESWLGHGLGRTVFTVRRH